VERLNPSRGRIVQLVPQGVLAVREGFPGMRYEARRVRVLGPGGGEEVLDGGGGFRESSLGGRVPGQAEAGVWKAGIEFDGLAEEGEGLGAAPGLA
jgi:hypothetical protein